MSRNTWSVKEWSYLKSRAITESGSVRMLHLHYNDQSPLFFFWHHGAIQDSFKLKIPYHQIKGQGTALFVTNISDNGDFVATVSEKLEDKRQRMYCLLQT